MIRINCTNCKAQLSIDDAFAGGVCRCQYCGTIQTVPKHLKSGDVGSSSGITAKVATNGPTPSTPNDQGSSSVTPPTAIGPGPIPPPAAAAGATFLGQKIPESTVIFVIDHGDATRATLEYLKLGLLKSIKSLRK